MSEMRRKAAGVRKNLYLTNLGLLRKMAGNNHSLFVDELIVREYRRRLKRAKAAA